MADLVALRGTEKQIAWAEQIRADVVRAIEAAGTADDLEAKRVARLLRQDSASWWITTFRERRNWKGLEILDALGWILHPSGGR